MRIDKKNTTVISNDTKKVFRKLGTCSRTYYHVLNREFGHNKEAEERAIDPLAGGIIQKGYQCGMLWGASLAVGAESYRRNQNTNQAIAIAIKTSQHLIESFVERVNTPNCRAITNCDFGNKWSMVKYLLTGKFLYCFKLAEKWTPEAIQVSRKGLSERFEAENHKAISCATEVAKKMKATNEQMITVAGFAGGIGLSGSGCGALSAAIWLKTLSWNKEHIGKRQMINQKAKEIFKAFNITTNNEVLCHKICNRKFNSLDEHTDYINSGGCNNLINILANY